ncbi:MAG: hypothetical protein H6812_03640 [Phycisphaeraceae bacterium]|nr:hypothetical protein [Phycisphaerales bacterium]MCB9842330.1 hypothetical protein [Phycisphaeraceae bacterium]
MSKRAAIDRYHSKLAEAQSIAKDAARDLREAARDLLTELAGLGEDYEKLMGEPMPELAGAGVSSGRPRTRRAPKRGRPAKKAGTGRRGKRSPLSGQFEGMTISEAVVALLKKNKSGLGPREITEAIGGNRNSVSVAMNSMLKDGAIKRIGRGLYTA